MPNLFEDLIPTKRQSDNLFGDLIPAGQSVKRVPVLGIDPTEHDELDVAVSAWDRAKFASGQLVRGVSTAIAGLPEAISIGAARKRYFPWGSPLRVRRRLLFFRNSENNEVTEILE